jgi:putative effector of murein hydrolase
MTGSSHIALPLNSQDKFAAGLAEGRTSHAVGYFSNCRREK